MPIIKLSGNQKMSYRNGKISRTRTSLVRRVEISDHLAEILRRLYTARKKEALKSVCGIVIETAFHNDREESIARNSSRNIFKRILRGAELRDFRFHVIRHTFASLL